MCGLHSNRTRSRLLLRAVAAGCATILMCAGPALGDYTYWQTGTGDWSVAANWSDGVPVPGVTALIGNGGTAKLFTIEACDGVVLGLWEGGGPHDGNIQMTGGSLTATHVRVGYFGTALFDMTGGDLNAPVYVGSNADDIGTFILSGGGNVTSTGRITVGWAGEGHFNQSAGTVSTSDLWGEFLTVGGRPSSDYTVGQGYGEYNLSGGDLYSRYAVIGGDGTGVFKQTGGSHDIGDDLYIGRLLQGNGTYTLDGSGAELSVGESSWGDLILGPEGRARFDWNAGSLLAGSVAVYEGPDSGNPNTFETLVDWTYHGRLFVKGGDVNIGHFTAQDWHPKHLIIDKTPDHLCSADITDGVLRAGWLTISDTAGPVTLTQTGGFVQVEGDEDEPLCFILGHGSDGEGEYQLDKGSLNVGWDESVGYFGTGNFVHTGGPHSVHGDLYLGHMQGSTGEYSLQYSGYNPKLIVDLDCYVGHGGMGAFNNTGGVHEVKRSLYLGHDEGITGEYTLAAGGSLTVGNYCYVGFKGFGTFLQQPGATVSIKGADSGYLQVGVEATGSGTYELNGEDPDYNWLDVNMYEWIGVWGDGTFKQNAGKHSIGAGGLTLARYKGAVGAFEMTGPSMLTVGGDEYIGKGGDGTFTQSGGTHDVLGSLYLAQSNDGTGQFTLDGADSVLTVQQGMAEYVGYQGAGIFTQTGGSYHDASDNLYLGYFADATGTYQLSDENTSLNVLNEYIGYWGTGVFTQDGGSNEIQNNLYIGFDVGSNGTYNLNGDGVLWVGGAKYVGYNGTGHYFIDGVPQNECDLYLGFYEGASGTCTISGGTTHAEILCVGYEGSGTLNIDDSDAAISVSEVLRFGQQSVFTAVPGAMIQMTDADFDVQSISPVDLEGLNNLAIVFDGGGDSTASLELCSFDYGAHAQGFVANFALGALTLGGDGVGRVELVDEHDNQLDWEGAEVLYVRSLEIGPGSYFDLNGAIVYYGHAVIDDDATVVLDGGELVQAPYAWSEDFDSYDTINPLPEQSTWEPWDGDPAAADFYATTAQSHSEPNSVAIDGNDDAVHRYPGAETGTWLYTVWIFVPQDMDDMQAFILLNDYPASEYHDWSLQIELDGANEIVKDHNGPDWLPMAKSQWVKLRVEIDLDEDLQTVYYNGAHLVTKGWSDGVEPGGALNIAAVDLYAWGSVYEVYYDDLTLEWWSNCPADFDGDGDVDTADLLYLLAAWGTPDGDVDGDGDTDTADLLDLLAAWGACP